MGWDGMGWDVRCVRWMDLPVCIAYHVLGFYVSAPLQEEGDCLLIAIIGRIMEGCSPTLQQQQRDRDRSGQVRSRKEQNNYGTVRQEIGQGRAG